MGITVQPIQVVDDLTGQSVDWTLANVGDKITVIIDFECAVYSLASTDNVIMLNVTDGYIGDGWCVSTNNAFTDFEVGDTVVVGNYVTSTVIGTYTIVAKTSNNVIQLDADVATVGDDFPSEQAIFSLDRDITGIEFKWNLIENSEALNWLSKVTGSTNIAGLAGIDATDAAAYPLDFISPLPTQIGSITIEGEGVTTTPYYSNSFRIRHNTFITPFMLASQREDLMNGVKPSYFDDIKCLKYVYYLKALYTYTNPNDYIEKTVSSDEGNVGWFDENFNTDETNYSVDSVVYEDNTATVIEALELTTNDQTVEITITNATDTPFSNGNTKFVLSFVKIPFDESEYVGTSTSDARDMKTNFCFDFAKSTVGVAAVNGNEYGTTRQVLKNVTATFVSSSEITINATVDFASEVVDILNESETPAFLLMVSVANHTLDFEESDKVQLRVAARDFFINTSDPDMIVTTNKFMRHFENDVDTEGVSVIDVFPEDDVVAYSRFYIDRNGRETDDINIKNIRLKIKAKKDVSNEFTLDSFLVNVPSTTPIDSTGHQAISVTINRNFHVSTSEIRKQIRVARRQDLDAGGLYYYDVYFPFIIGWEYWKALSGVDSEFFDSAEPNNNQNQEYNHYDELANWDIYFEIEINADKNEEAQQYVTETQITTHPYDDNADWEPESVLSYDPDTLTQLTDGVSDFVLGYKNTLIEARFESQTGTPDLNNIACRFWIEVYEEGGRDGSRRFSTEYAQTSDTWFISTDTSNLITLTLDGDVVVAQALVDFTEIPVKPNFKIMARLYEKDLNVCGVGGRQLEDGVCRKQEDGVQRIVE